MCNFSVTRLLIIISQNNLFLIIYCWIQSLFPSEIIHRRQEKQKCYNQCNVPLCHLNAITNGCFRKIKPTLCRKLPQLVLFLSRSTWMWNSFHFLMGKKQLLKRLFFILEKHYSSSNAEKLNPKESDMAEALTSIGLLFSMFPNSVSVFPLIIRKEINTN